MHGLRPFMTLDDVLGLSEREWRRVPNCGVVTLTEIKRVLDWHGRRLRQVHDASPDVSAAD